MYELQESLAEITGMNKVSLQPAAGSQGELTGLMIIKAYHEKNGDFHRKKIIVPDSAHGTNPASAQMAGYQVQVVKGEDNGNVSLSDLKTQVHD